MLGLSLIWIGVCAIILVGLAIITGVGKTQNKDDTLPVSKPGKPAPFGYGYLPRTRARPAMEGAGE